MEIQIPLFLGEIGTLIAIITIALTVASATYSLVAAHNARKKFRREPDDTRVSNVANQGAFVPLLIGRHRVGCVVAWIGDRWAKPGRRSKHTATLYQESGWHLLCVGPAKRLFKIWANGEQIFPDPNSAFTGTLDSTTHPSGTLISVWRGDFRIYWGEPDQPANTFLANANRVGVESRWPHVCYVVWERYGLEFNPIWPRLEYELEVEPYNTAISDLTSEIDQMYDDGGDVYNANLGYGILQILTEEYPHGINLNPSDEIDYSAGAGGGGDVELSRIHEEPATDASNGPHTFEGDASGTPGSSDAGTYDLTHSPPYYAGGGMEEETNWVGLYLNDGYESGYIDRLYVYLKGPSGQTVDLYDQELGDFYDGSDIYSWMPPSGWDIDTDLFLAYAQFDLSEATLNETGVWELWVRLEVTFDNNPNESLSATAQVTLLTQADPPSGSVREVIELADTEGLAGTILALRGDVASDVLSDTLQDMGVFMHTKCNGKLGFSAVRQVDAADAIVLDQDQVEGPAVELTVMHGLKNIDRMLFTFEDKERNFRKSVIQIDEDGQAADAGNVKGVEITMPSVVDFDVAAVVAERRSQEELAGKASYTINALRGGHRIQPGKVIKVPGIDPYLRVLEVQLSNTSDAARLKCLNDFYGVEAAEYVQPEYDNGQVQQAASTANDAEDFFEIPEHIGSYGHVLIAPLMIREGRHNYGQVINFSNDDSVYTAVQNFYGVPFGGTLDEAIAADDAYYIEQGPEFSMLGQQEDIEENALDLSSDEAGWRSGKQMALINDELFFVREVTEIVAGTTYRLDGLLRARFDTYRGAHSINDTVILIRADDLEGFTGDEARPGETLYVKSQPFSGGSPLALASVDATNKTLIGKGVTPMPVAALDVIAPFLGVPAYETGDDVEFRWAHRSSELVGTGAGMQGAGDAVGSSSIRGEFEVEVYNTGDTLVEAYTGITTTDWTYTNANLQSDLGGEVDFYILVRNVNGGWKSPAVRIDVEAI